MLRLRLHPPPNSNENKDLKSEEPRLEILGPLVGPGEDGDTGIIYKYMNIQ